MTKATQRKVQGVHRKFMSALLSAAFAFVLVAACIGYHVSYEHSLSHSQHSVGSLARTVQRHVAIGVYAGDKALLAETLEHLRAHDLVKHVAVHDATGASIAESGERVTGALLIEDDSHRKALRVSERLASPFDAREHLGQLVLTLDDDALRALARWDAFALSGGLVGLVVMLVAVLNHVALRHVSMPLRHLADQLATVEPGTESTVAVGEAHRTNELGTVASAVNRLLHANAEALQRERRMRKKVTAIEQQYRQLFDVTSAGIFLLSGKGELITHTPTVTKLLGATDEHMQTLRSSDFVAQVFEDAARVRDMIQHAMTHRRTVARDLCVRDMDGERRWVHCLLSVHVRKDAKAVGATATAAGTGTDVDEVIIEGVMYDVTRREHKESVASHRAEHDPLTGLKNRAGIERELAHCLAMAHQRSASTSLLFIDLDGFKQVNDDYGHDVGDLVLIEFAQRLKRLVREDTDFVGRLGGDEMVLVLNGMAADSDAVAALATRVVQTLSLPVMLVGGREVRLGASVGVAGFPMHAGNATALIRAADAAMYRVKRDGKNNFSLAEEADAVATNDLALQALNSDLLEWQDDTTVR